MRKELAVFCCAMGLVLLIGGASIASVSETYYVGLQKQKVYPYREQGVPMMIWGFAFLIAGVAVYTALTEEKL